MKKTRYYTKYQPGSPVFRRIDNGRTRLEKWNGELWVDWPNLIAATGIGGDTSYEQITEAEAQKLIADQRNR